MSALTDYLKSALANHVLRGTSYTQPTTIAIALCTAASDSGYTELANSNGYARATIGRGNSEWSYSSGTASNAAEVVFTAASANWSSVTHIVLLDSATYGGGNALFWKQLDSALTVNSGDSARVTIGDLDILWD